MSIRQGGPTLAAVVLLGSVAIAQSSTQAPAATGKSSTSDEQVTIVGCIQRETDYRKAQDKGRGGVAGTGLGRDNEYVLINARRSEAAPGALDCTSSSSAEAYELTGNRESDLKGFVGRAVQVTGTIKKAEVKPVGTTGATQPTGGFDPLGQDLRLFELDVTAFSEIGTLAQAPPGATVPAADARPAAAPARPTPPANTQSPATPQTPANAPAPATRAPAAAPGAKPLPDTASPLPIAGLIGLLSLGGAAGLRMLRRR